MRFADNNDENSPASRMRAKRFSVFAEHLRRKVSGKKVNLLDVGGTVEYWTVHLKLLRKEFPNATVCIVNLETSKVSLTPPEGVILARGDARDLSAFQDGEFEMVYSNSVIEHVGTLFDQQRAATEMVRVGRSYFIQTPAAHFPIEPHFLVPFWQCLPLFLRATALRCFDLGWMKRQPNRLLARAEVEQIRLLKYWELRALFPKGRIVRERFLFMTKSFMAMN